MPTLFHGEGSKGQHCHYECAAAPMTFGPVICKCQVCRCNYHEPRQMEISLLVNNFCCLQHNKACIIDAVRWVGEINLERNGLYAHFSTNQHFGIGNNIV